MFLLQDGTECGWVTDVVLVRTKSAKYIFSNNDVSENRTILGFTQRVVVISYRRFGATPPVPPSVFLFSNPEDEADRLSPDIVNKSPLLAA
jgi:hypothetical protein